MDSKSSWSQQHFSKTGSFGHQLFTDMSQVCMELTMVKRQNSSQLYCKELLGHLRIGQTTEEDAKYLMALHLGNLSANDTEQVLNNGTVMHLFATKAPRNDHNYKCISRISSSDNPVAMVKAQWSSTTKKKATAQADHFQNPPPSATLLCRGAMVRIVTRNFEPKWGLYTNAIGTIRDIVYEDGKDPNNGDLPLYVATDFKHYEGPAWIPYDKTVSEKNQKYFLTFSMCTTSSANID